MQQLLYYLFQINFYESIVLFNDKLRLFKTQITFNTSQQYLSILSLKFNDTIKFFTN